MTNQLTGSYDAVLQLSLRQINGLLATLHQNGASDDPPLRLGHHGIVRIGDPQPSRPEPRSDFRNWVRNFQIAGGLETLDRLRTQLSITAPPGIARRIEDSLSTLGRREPGKTPLETVRGTVKLAFSSPTISATEGSTSEVTLRVRVRAHYHPDPGTTAIAAPEHPVHGEVRAAFELRVLVSEGARKLSIQPSAQDSKIQFTAAPGTSLSARETARISSEVRRIMREHFTPLPVDLPPNLPFAEFRTLGSGSSQVLALPVQLSAAPASGGHIQSITHSFVDSSGFAVAASKAYVEGLLAPLLDRIRSAIRGFRKEITVSAPLLGARLAKTIRFTLQLTSGPSLAWESGAIKLSAKLKLIVRPGADVSFTFTQKLKLALDGPRQTVTLEPDGDPAVNTDWPFNLLHDAFENAIKDARERALSGGSTPINDAVNQVFDGAKQKLLRGLKAFDPSASAAFTAVKITADGLIVRGEIGSAPRQAPVVRVGETDDGRTFSAVASWIPGGSIDRFIWSWTEHSGQASKISPAARSFTEEHRFTLPKPASFTGLGSISLRIEGTQVSPDGRVVSVAAESPPQRRDAFGPIVAAPAWWEPVTVPAWLPGAPPGAPLRDQIAGHISLQRDIPPTADLTHNSLVFFADPHATDPLQPLVRALAAMRRQRVSLVLIIVLPADALDDSRHDVETILRGIPDRFAGRVMLADDGPGGWTRTFAVSKRPSAHLVNARQEFVWAAEGDIDSTLMAAALDKHILPAPAPRSHPLRLAMPRHCCERAPDVSFVDHRGARFALHRMRGREVLLNFWQSWSAPCIRELLRLQGLQNEASPRAPFIVAFHAGTESSVLTELRKRHGLTFSLVQDSDQVIARTYGVTCWPTTISIDADGFISRVQFGVGDGPAREAGPQPRRRKTTSSRARRAR